MTLAQITPADLVGLLGTVILISTYGALQAGKIKTGMTYSLLNLAASLLLTVSLVVNFNLASFMIELFWIAISLLGIYKAAKERANERATRSTQHSP